jgi:hypothetical protein
MIYVWADVIIDFRLIVLRSIQPPLRPGVPDTRNTTLA